MLSKIWLWGIAIVVAPHLVWPEFANAEDHLEKVTTQIPTVIDRETELLKAIQLGRLDDVKKAARSVDLRHVTNLPYHALVCSNAEVVDFLRREGHFNISDLQIAAIRGDAQTVDQLLTPLDKAARVRALAVWYDGFTSHSPLALAVRNGNLKTVQKLIAFGANVNESSRYSLTPLANAAERGHTDVLNVLLEAGAAVNSAPDGYTALMRACIEGQTKAAELLIAAGADEKLSRHDGRTALHFATLGEHVDCITLLLKHGADANAIAYKTETPRSLAARSKNPAVLRAYTQPDVE